ncbi:hypothetical protein DM02DRAFT_674678 [Periconia macrospinosa]|uniref:Uncharacterized protein n=1 Tax=Periconia macrospinosa TaxID=97972 RepID=A0A2V1DHM7_9PLEO|nr:hypothetical protein DM02DRAFT_674678 [Periconia macrospinosa]
MIRCKICLEEATCDIAPAVSCVRRSLEYINLNQRIVKRTLEYVENEKHLERCPVVKRERAGVESDVSHLSNLQKLRYHLRTIVESLLHKRLQIYDSIINVPGNTGKKFLCPDLMLFYMEATAHTLDTVKASLAAMDERSNEKCGYFTNVDADDAEHLLPSVVPGFEEVSKIAYLRKLHVALKWTEVIEARAAGECSKLTCLSDMFKLPREVRNMVYHELVVPGTGTFVLQTLGTGREPIRVPYDWCMNPKFVGHAMALEVAELYYTKTDFQIHNPELFPDIFPTILPRDPLGTKVQTFQLIRRLGLVWDMDCSKPNSFKEMYDILDHLTLISRKDLLRFDLLIRGFENEFFSPPQTLNTLEMLRKPVYDLKHAGSTIRVDQILEGPFIKTRELINWLKGSSAAASGNSGFFTLSAEDWEKASAPPSLAHEKLAVGLWDPSVNFVDDSIDAAQVRSLLEKRWGIINPMQSICHVENTRTCWLGWGHILTSEEDFECDLYS